MRLQIVAAAALVLTVSPLLTGCVTYEYRKVSDGPDYERAIAYCQMQSYGVPQNTNVYIGSAVYANSMALSQSLANQARVDGFVQNCMRVLGWGLFEVQPKKKLPPA